MAITPTPKAGITDSVTAQAERQERRMDERADRKFAKEPGIGAFQGLGYKLPWSSGADGSEELENLYQLFVNAFEKMRESNGGHPTGYNVFKLNKADYSLNYSGVIVTMTSGETVSAYVMMVESTGRYPTKTQEGYSNLTYEVTRTPGDALLELDPVAKVPKYLASVVEEVHKRLGTPKDKICVTDGTLAVSEFRIEDPTNPDAYTRFINNTLSAPFVENNVEVDGYYGRSIRELTDDPNSKFLIDTEYLGPETQVTDQMGQPIRADIRIRLSATTYDHSRASMINRGDGNTDIVEVYGYIDFLWQKRRENTYGQPISQTFVPNFVITHMESTSSAMSPSIVVCGLLTALAATEDQNWVRHYTFKSVRGKGEKSDINEIGLLNIEGNLEAFYSNKPAGFGAMWDSNKKDVTSEEIFKFINSLVYPDVLISIDVPQAGTSSWYTSIFGFIADVNNNQAQYADFFQTRLYTAISKLVGKEFNDGGQPVFTELLTNLVHGGYYMIDNKMHDLREISSYLGWASYLENTGQSMERLVRMTATFQNVTTAPKEIRAAEREKLIQEVAHGRAVIKQYYTRLTFNGQWLTNLAQFLAQGGLQPINSNARNSNDVFERNSLDLTGFGVSPGLRVSGVGNVRQNYNQNTGLSAYHRLPGQDNFRR